MAPPKASKGKTKRKAEDGKVEHDHPTAEAEAESSRRSRSPAPKVPKLVEHPSHGTVLGEVLTFGTGDTGQLGLGEVMERKKPALVTLEEVDDGLVQICCGGMHTIALAKDGRVFSWGCNDEGSLGRLANDGTALADDEECAIPGPVQFPEGTPRIVQISAGDSHSAALTEHGDVFFWGGWRDNSGIMTDKYPSPLAIPLSSPITKISSGCHHILFLAASGQVFSMGCGENGQLGRLSERFATRNARNWQTDLMTPAIVPLKYAFKKGLSKSGEAPIPVQRVLAATNVWAGGYTSVVQLQSGHVLGFGLNSAAQLGVASGGTNEAACVFQPKFLPDISNLEVAEISCGHHHTLILSKSGVVHACGLKEYGALGVGGTDGVVEKPIEVKIADGEIVKTVAAGTHLSFAVTEKGAMYSWGSATNNALGHGDEEDKEEPEEVTSKQLETREVVAVAVGGQHTAIIAVGNNNNNNSA